MSENTPPDPSAHDQVHDWAADRGMETVDVLQLHLSCPKCHSNIECAKHEEAPGWVYLTHLCLTENKIVRVRVRDEHLIQRFPCEADPPESESSGRPASARRQNNVPGRRRSLREYAEALRERVRARGELHNVDFIDGAIVVNGMRLDAEQAAQLGATIDRAEEIERRHRLFPAAPLAGLVTPAQVDAIVAENDYGFDSAPRTVHD